MKRIFIVLILVVFIIGMRYTGWAESSTGSISGRVISHSDNIPLEGAKVTLYKGTDENIADSSAWYWVAWIQTNENGDYQFSGLDQRRYRIHIYDQEISGIHYLGTDIYNVQVFEGVNTPDMDFSLRQAGLIYGYVKSTDGTPIPNAELITNCTWIHGGNDTHSAHTDSNGRYEFWVPPSPGEFYPIRVQEAMLSGTSYAPSIWDGNFYKATLAGTRVPDFILEIGGEITGRVLNEEGQGISNICPHLIGPANWTCTDPDGYFSLKSVPSGINYIRLFGKGIGPGGIKYSVGEAYKGPIEIAPGQTVDVGTFTVYRAAMLTGIVTDQDGNPIMGAEVDLNGYDINGNLAGKNPVFTDAFGQYTIDFIAPGVFTIDFQRPGFLPNKIIGIHVISDRPVSGIDMVLKSDDNGASVSGKILNYEDVVPYDSNNIQYPSYVTASLDPLGDYGYGLVAVSMDRNYTEGDYLNPDQFSGGGIDQEGIEDGYADFFEKDSNENPGIYSMPIPNGDIAIGMYVLYEEYGPVTPGCLIFHGWKRFIFTKGDVRQNIDFTATTTQTGTLRGDITVPQGYDYFPENWCFIYAIKENNQTAIPLGDAIASPGRALTFEFINMPEGVYTLNAYARNLASVRYASVEVIAGQTTTKDIVFTSGGTLKGQLSCDTNAIAGAVVTIEEIGRQAATDTSGNYTIQGINPGTYTVNVTAAGYAGARTTVSISAGSTTYKDFTLYTNIGSIAGTVKDGDGNNINGAKVVAYNKTDQLYRTTETVGGAFSITQLPPGQYLVAVDTPEHGVVVYPSEITLSTDQGVTGIAIIAGEVQPPFFALTSSASDDVPIVLSIEFYSDRDLNDEPLVTIVEGNGSLGSLISNSPKNRFEVDYISDASDTIVKIKIEETNPLVIGNPGSKTFTFELGSNLVQTSSTKVTNATGGAASIMGTQDLTKIYVPPFAIAGADDKQALTLTIERYGDPGGTVEGTSDRPVSAVYDFSFDEEGISIDVNHTFTVTMSFRLPNDMSQKEFESTFEVRYFDAGDQEWKTDGISNISINWANSTIMFEINHLTKFAAFVPSKTPCVIVIDGIFDDWNEIESIGIDPNDMPDDDKDLKEIYVTNDNDFLYIRWIVYGNFNPFDPNNSYTAYLDTDRNIYTGYNNGWWNIGADYRIYMDHWNFGLQKFMGTSETEDIWGWDGVPFDVKPIDYAYSGGSIECCVRREDIGETDQNEATGLLFRVIPGDDSIHNYWTRTLIYIYTGYKCLLEQKRIPNINNYICYYGGCTNKKIDYLSKFDLAIIQPTCYTKENIEAIKATGTKVLAYVSTSEDTRPGVPLEGDKRGPCYFEKNTDEIFYEDANHASYYLDEYINDTFDPGHDGLPDQNPVWEGYYVNVGDPNWQNYIINTVLPPLAEKGYDGFFLDNVGFVEAFVYAWISNGMISLISAIRDTYPNKYLVVNNAFSLLDRYEQYVNAVMFESFTSHWIDSGYRIWPDDVLYHNGHISNNINIIRNYPCNPTINVLSLDYCDSNDTNCIYESMNRAKFFGFIPSVSNKYLDKNYVIDCDGDGYPIEDDCNDFDPNVNSEATEICDGIDNNCDEKVDIEGSQGCTIYYKDEDHDGQGVDGDSRCLCNPDELNNYIAIYSGDPDDSDPNLQGTILDIPAGWSMISLPLIPDTASLSELFLDAVVLYGYEKGLGYVRVAEDKDLQPGNGYWILLDQNQTYNLTGQVLNEYTITVENGWYMIGGCSSEAEASIDNGNIAVIYCYVQGVGYQRVLESEYIESGVGYWILLNNINNQAQLKIAAGGGDDNNNVTVSGTVLDVSGAPLNGAQVTITSDPVIVYTDSNGIFSAEIDAGDHDIVIRMGATTIYTSSFTCFTCDGNASCDLGDISCEYCDFTSWRKHLHNPLFSSSGTGSWDDPLMSGTVLKDQDEPVNKYKMWYVCGKTVYDEGMSIGYATSTDRINWVPYQNNPVMTHGDTWDILGFSGINVIKDGSTYKLWYEGIDNNGVNRIGYATSTDGINWVPYTNNPVFSPGVNGSWDDADVGDPCVVKEGSTYKMWYWGDNETDIDQIGLATSNDGINWQRTGTDGLVMSPDPNVTWENGEGIGVPEVIKNASGYTMAYHAADQWGNHRVGIATSVDGITWNKETSPILDAATENAWDSVGVFPMSLIDNSICLKLWYFGTDTEIDPPNLKVGLAVSCN